MFYEFQLSGFLFDENYINDTPVDLFVVVWNFTSINSIPIKLAAISNNR